MSGRKNTFWRDVAQACPGLVNRELYLRFGMASPSERKIILLSGGRIQDFHSQRTFDSRKELIEFLKEAVPEVKELDEKSWNPQRNVYTLTGRRGWSMEKIVKYLKMNKEKAVNADIFFQPSNCTPGRPIKHKLQNSNCDSKSSGGAKRTRQSVEPSEKEPDEREEQGMKNLKHQPRKKKRQKKREENKESETALKEKENTGDENLQEPLLILAETCSSALNKEYETSLQEKEKTGNENPQLTHCRTENGENEMYSINAGRDVLENHSYASCGPSKPSSFPPTSDADRTSFQEGGSLSAEENANECVAQTHSSAENKESGTSSSMKEKEKTGDETLLQMHCSTVPVEENANESFAQTPSSTESKETETSRKEKGKTGDENPQQTHCRTENGQNEVYLTDAGRDVVEIHSYASCGQTKACSFPPTSDADGTSFREGGSLLPEELVLYGLLYVNGTYDPFTPQAGNTGGFASVATVANCITASSSYSSEGIKTYLSVARSANNQHNVGLHEGKLRWMYFKSEVGEFVEKQGQKLRLLLSNVHNINQSSSATIEDIRETAMAICENRSEPTDPPCATDAPYTLQSLKEDWKELRDQWENCHLSYRQDKFKLQLLEVFFHFHSPTDPSSPACDKTLQVHQDMTWTLKVQGRTASTEAWELPRTICQQSDIQTVLKFIQVRGVVCDGCKYEKYEEMVQKSFPNGIFNGKDGKTVMTKVESFGGQKCIRSQQCVLFFASNRSVHDTSAHRNTCDFCRRQIGTLNSMLSRYNLRKTTKTSIYTNIKYLPREELEKQLADTRQSVRVLQNTCGKLQAELTKCNDTNKPDTSNNVPASHVPGVSACKEPAGHTPMGRMEQSTSDKPRTKKVAQPKANKSSTSHPKDPALHTPRKKVAQSKAKKPSVSPCKKPASATPMHLRRVKQSTATKPSIKTMEQATAEASISSFNVPASHTPMMEIEQSDLPPIATPVVVEGVDDLYTFCSYSTVNMSALFD